MLENFDLILIPTRKCNLSCRYCPVEKRDRSLRPAAALDALERFIKAGGKSVRLTGGEPLLEWEFVAEIVVKIEEIGGPTVHLEICTNGLLLDRRRLLFLRRPWITIVISLDGDMETHVENRLGEARGEEKFLKLLDITRESIKNNNYFVTQTIAPGSKSGAFDNFFFLWSLGVKNLNFLPVYYKIWSPAEVRSLKKDLLCIASFLKPYIMEKKARVRNIERRGIIPLFGNSICLDVDEKYYFTNAVLLKKLKPVNEQLKIADRFEEIGNNLPLILEGERGESIINTGFSRKVIRSNRNVDAAVTSFVNELKHPSMIPDGRKEKRGGMKKEGRPERLELHLSYKCTNDCIFCSERHRLERFHRWNVTALEAWTALLRHREAGGTHVNFTGGEPTIHPNFIALAQGAKNLGLTIYVGTNGVMLGREDFARAAAPMIDELSISIHGPDKKTHNALTRNNESFSNILETARHAKRIKPGIMLMANMVVTKENFGGIIPTLSLCAELGVGQMLISNPSPEGRALDIYEDIIVPPGEWKRIIDEIVEAAEERNLSIRFFGFPACILGKWKTKSNDLFFDPRITVERARKASGRIGMSTIITRYPRRGRRKLRECTLCSFNDLCGGIFKEYVKIYKNKEITPI